VYACIDKDETGESEVYFCVLQCQLDVGAQKEKERCEPSGAKAIKETKVSKRGK
jgi:hypothetical protein